MLFAAWDYIEFRKEAGRYARETGSDLMCGGYRDALPSEVLLALQNGDLILMGNFGWWVSWLIMYLTSSQISHVAVYVGDGKILHATLSGGELAPIETLFRPCTRLLACKAPIPAERRKSADWSAVHSFVGRPYSKLLVLWKAMVILSGRDVDAFRWKFFFDLILLLFAADAIWFLASGSPFGFYWIVPAYLGVIVINRFRWPPSPASWFRQYHGKPCDMLRWVVQYGGAFMPDPMSPWAQRAYRDPGSPWESHVFRRRDGKV